MKKQYLALFIGIFLSLSFISAFAQITEEQPLLKEGIEISDSASEYPAVQIKDWLGLGSPLVDLVLTDNSNSCSDDCLAEWKQNTYTDSVLVEDIIYKKVLEDGSYIDGYVTNEKILYSDSTEDKEVDDYELICKATGEIAANGSAINYCNYQKVGSHIKKENVWKEYIKGTSAPAGNYTMRLIADKKISDKIDWQIITQNKIIDSWAIWGAGGTSAHGLTQTSTASITELTGFLIRIKSNITIKNLTIIGTSTDTKAYIYNATPSGGNVIWGTKLAETNITSLVGNFNFNLTTSATWNNSYFVVVDQGGASRTAYMNMTDTQRPIVTTYFNYTNGAFSGGGTLYACLYGGACGSNYAGNIVNIGWETQAGSISLVSPINNYVSTNKLVNFNCSVSLNPGYTSSNISLYINNVLNETKSVLGTVNSTIFSKNMSNGIYNWTCSARNSDNILGFADSNRTLTVASEGYLSLCDSTYNVTYLNITFKDENTLNYINASINPLNFSYYFSNASNAGNLYLINTTENSNYAFCYIPSNETLKTANGFYIRYYSSGYPARTATLTGTWTNSTTQQILYLLNAADGLDVTFQVVDNSLQALAGASVVIEANGIIVASGTTDASGLFTSFLNTQNLHSITVSKTGYTTSTSSIYPTQSQYSIVLTSALPGQNITNPNAGISYYILPAETFLQNNTAYNFNFTINSTFWTLDSFGINITNGTTQIGSASTTGNYGTINTNVNTGSNSSFYVRGYWDINGTRYYTSPLVFTIWTASDTEWSISYLVSDLRSYLASGMFGLTMGFNMNLLIFFIIFIVTGIFSWKYGLYGPIQIAGIVMVLTLLFDLGLGLITTVPDHLASVITTIIFIGIFIKEALGY